MMNLGYIIATAIFAGIFNLTAVNPVKAQSRVVTFSQYNQMRVQAGYPPLTGNRQQDISQLQYECSRGVQSSCMILQGQIEVVRDQSRPQNQSDPCAGLPVPEFIQCINEDIGIPPTSGRGRSSRPNPNRHQCVEQCRQGCPEPTLEGGGPSAAIQCQNNCVDQCY